MENSDDQAKEQNNFLQTSGVDDTEWVHYIEGQGNCEDHVEQFGAVDARQSSKHVVEQALVEDHDVHKFTVRQDAHDC